MGTAQGRQAGDVRPCDAWSEPLSEGDPPVVEEVVVWCFLGCVTKP